MGWNLVGEYRDKHAIRVQLNVCLQRYQRQHKDVVLSMVLCVVCPCISDVVPVGLLTWHQSLCFHSNPIGTAPACSE